VTQQAGMAEATLRERSWSPLCFGERDIPGPDTPGGNTSQRLGHISACPGTKAVLVVLHSRVHRAIQTKASQIHLRSRTRLAERSAVFPDPALDL